MYETVRELHERLAELVEDGRGDTKLRIAYQPTWPLAATVDAVADVDDGDGVPTIWIAAGSSVPGDEHPYAPKDAWEEW